MFLCYTVFVATPRLAWKGGLSMDDYILSFFIAVAAGVVCHYIIKWLDDDN